MTGILGILSALISGGATGLIGVFLQRFFDFKGKQQDLELVRINNEHARLLAQMEVDKANLVKETLAYARLVAKLNKQLKVAPDDQLAQLVATTKETLDSKRASHNASMATAKEQLNHANTGVFFCYHEDTVKAVLEQLATKANYSEQATSHRLQLEAELSAFEQHVATLT